MAGLEDRFERDGFILVKRVLAEQEVRALRRFLTDALGRHQAMPGLHCGIQTRSTPCQAIWPDFYQINPDWFGVFCNRRIVDPLHRLLGSPFILTRDSIAHWDYFPDWHTDTTTSEVAGKLFHRNPDWRMLTVGLYLQSGGGLSVVTGSHRAPDPFVEARKNRGDGCQRSGAAPWSAATAVDIEIEPGDAVIFDMRLVHRASQSVPMTPAGEPCQKLTIFSRVSRNIPDHVTNYSEFQFNGAGVAQTNLDTLRERAREYGFLVA